MQFHRVRRGQRGRLDGTRRLQPQRAEAGGRMTQRLPDLAGETSHRGFAIGAGDGGEGRRLASVEARGQQGQPAPWIAVGDEGDRPPVPRSEEHTSELQSLMRISYAVFCLNKKTTKKTKTRHNKNTTT